MPRGYGSGLDPGQYKALIQSTFGVSVNAQKNSWIFDR